MKVIKPAWVGWKKEGTSDKVWGVFCIYDNSDNNQKNGFGWFAEDLIKWGDAMPKRNLIVYNFWGRRGKTLQFKKLDKDNNIVVKKKINKGYRLITNDQFHKIFPDASEQIQSAGLMALLGAE